MLTDYHMHLIHDGHEEKCPYNLDRVATYLKVAESRGIDEIGITEHCDRFREFLPIMEHLFQGDGVYEAVANWLSKRFYEPLDEYVEVLVRAKQRGWPVKVGLEVDYIPGAEEPIQSILADYPWDYVLGSVHFIGKWGIDISPESGWPEQNVDEAYVQYFGLLSDAAASGLYDVLAHPDLIKKFGHRPSQAPTSLYEQFVSTVNEAGVAVEVSTAGLRRGENELYPGPQLLELLFAHNVPITFGSDAHYPEHVGADYATSVAESQAVGYKEITRFTERVATQHPMKDPL